LNGSSEVKVGIMIFFCPAKSHWVEKLPTQSMAALKIKRIPKDWAGLVHRVKSHS